MPLNKEIKYVMGQRYYKLIITVNSIQFENIFVILSMKHFLSVYRFLLTII